ncbi:MAG TPA: YjgP/YjgQ family permease [Planctomycetes bacterium]|nr:YjgP/YjgQ family permease [Planctomycetota bacterium]
MARITRYIVKELLLVFGIALTGMSLFLILGVVAVEAVREGLGMTAVVRLLPYALPVAMRFAIPATILFAVCSVYGRLSAANEMLAIKSLGISPSTIIFPAVALSFLISIGNLWLNDVAVSWGETGMNRVILQSVEQIAYSRLRTHKSYSNSHGLVIRVDDVRGKKLIRPVISYPISDDSRPLDILADEAELSYDEEKLALVVSFKNVILDGDKISGRLPGTVTQEIPLWIASKKGKLSNSPSGYALNQLPAETSKQTARTRELEQRAATAAATAYLLGETESFDEPDWSNQIARLNGEHGRLNRLYTETWRRFATGFSCLFFVLVGVPLAIQVKTADFWTTFALCFIPILLIYYPLLAFGVAQAKSGDLPPYVVWAGNGFMLVWGLFLMRRVMRH